MKKTVAVITAFFITIVTTACSVEFPKDLKNVEGNLPKTDVTPEEAFEYDNGIGGVELPKDLEIGEGIWDYLPEIDVTPEDAFIYEYDNELGGTVITDYLKEAPKVRFPDTIESEPVVEVDLYYCKKQLTEIVMPDTVVDFRFSDEIKDNLQYLNVPAAYKVGYDERDFYDRDYPLLEAIYISEGVESVVFGNPYYDPLYNTSDYSTINIIWCKSLKKVYLPDSVILIGYDASEPFNGFACCKALESIRLPAGITELGMETFAGCENLKSIKIPEGVTTLGDGVFYGCTSLENIEIPESVTALGDGAFYGCESLKSIKLPEGVTVLGEGVFNKCVSLKTATLNDGLTEIGNFAFENCESLGSIKLPEGVTTLGNSAFLDCTNLKTVTLNDGLTKIGASAFMSCKSLESVKIPKSVTALGNDTFYNCTSLKNVVIDGEIDNGSMYYAFLKCDWENLKVKYRDKTYNTFSELKDDLIK